MIMTSSTARWTSGAFLSAAAATVLSLSAVAQAGDPGRLYGRVTTLDGDTYEGFIRWDQNEGHWADVLDASKRIPSRHIREARRLSGREMREETRGRRILGIRVGRGERSSSTTASSAIRLGHIHRLQVLDDEYALLVLKSGEEQELRRSSTDLGTSNRGIIVENGSWGDIELRWRDIDEIEFIPAPRGTGSPLGERLYGTLVTRGGDEFTGWITWDMDEIFGEDELDGREGRRSRSIKFRSISKIERDGSTRAIVTLTSGEEVTLRGTNDVNDDNRGIIVGDRDLGQVRVEWEDFEEVRFHELPSNLSYSEFDGGRHLSGTVYTVDGDEYAGAIRWDNDEEWTWEVLDGGYRGLEFDIEFGLIQSIERESRNSSRVTLMDGRSFVLRGSNDVNDENKGVFIEQDSGDTVMVYWDEFERVEFDNQ
jgi:hypothetical protein